MFNRHEFTCEDVIYLRNRHNKTIVANVAAVVVVGSAMWVYGTYLAKKEQHRAHPKPSE